MHNKHISMKKRKTIVVDEDGFQQVKNRKNTRRNIFGEERRPNDLVQADETRTSRYRSKPHEGEISRPRTDQSNHVTLVEKNPGNNQGACGRESRSEGNRVAGMLPSADTVVTEKEAMVRLESPVEGRGDPTSTMLWSPRKHVGQKKNHLTERHWRSRRMKNML